MGEEPESRTLWIGKALPREWLEVGESAVVAEGVTTRYGRISFSLNATMDTGTFCVRAAIALPRNFAMKGDQPEGGVRLRIRAPAQYAGHMHSVTVGGKAWNAFDPQEETVAFASSELQSSLLDDMKSIVVQFSSQAP